MRITTERVLQETSEFGVTIWNIGCGVGLRLRRISKGRDDVTKGKETAVNRDTLFYTFSSSSSTLELYERAMSVQRERKSNRHAYSFRTSQVHEVELRHYSHPLTLVVTI